MKPDLQPYKESLQLLAQEMENMIIEGNLKKDTGPLKSLCEGAITSGRHVRQFEVHADKASISPSRVSPIGAFRPLVQDIFEKPCGSVDSGQKGQLLPPELPPKSSKFARARSVSC